MFKIFDDSDSDDGFDFNQEFTPDLAASRGTLEHKNSKTSCELTRSPLVQKDNFPNNPTSLNIWNNEECFKQTVHKKQFDVAHTVTPFTAGNSPNPVISTRQLKETPRRRFPGPAGVLPPRQDVTLIAPEEFLDEQNNEENSPKFQGTEILSQRSMSIFDGGAWSAMLEDLATAGQSLLQRMNLASIKVIGRNLRSYKVPFLAVLVLSVDATLPEVAVIFKDPTGEMHGVIHRDVWEQFGPDITANSVLVLRNVGIISAGISLRKQVVNVTSKNLTALYSVNNEQNIELKQVGSLPANQSWDILAEWEKVEGLSTSASSRTSPKTPTFTPLVHQLTNDRKKPNCSPITSCNRSNLMARASQSKAQINNSRLFVPTVKNSHEASDWGLPPGGNPINPFSLMGSPLQNGDSVAPSRVFTSSNKPSVIENSTAEFQRNSKSKFTFKVPLSNHDFHCSNSTPVMKSVTMQQKSSSQVENSPPESAYGQTKRSKTFEIAKPSASHNTTTPNTTKTNHFLLESDVESLLNDIDTDSLFGDF